MDPNSSEICSSNLSLYQRKEILAIFGGGGIAAVAICSVALALLIFFKMYKTYSERLVLYLLLSALFFSLVLGLTVTGTVFDFKEHHSLCQTLGFLFQYSMWVLLLFTIFIVFHLASLIFLYRMFNKIEVFLILFSLIFPILFAWVPFIHDAFGLSGAWCWIVVHRHSECSVYNIGLIEQYALWWGPFFFFLIINAVLTFAMIIVLCCRAFRKQTSNKIGERGRTVQDDSKSDQAAQYKKALRNTLPLLAYPIIYISFDWFALANRIRQAVSPDTGNSYSLWILHAFAGPSRGFSVGVTFIVYVVVKKKLTKASVKEAYYSWKHSYARMRRSLVMKSSYQQVNSQYDYNRHVRQATDVLTAEGYTETSPTLYEPPRESEVFK